MLRPTNIHATVSSGREKRASDAVIRFAHHLGSNAWLTDWWLEEEGTCWGMRSGLLLCMRRSKSK